MALSQTEQEIVQYGKQNGKSLVETKAALSRYRQEQTKQVVSTKDPVKQRSFLDRMSGAANKALDFTGGGVVAEKIGGAIARGSLGEGVQKAVIGRDLTPTEEATVPEGPSGVRVAGDVARTAANFTPVGKLTGLAASGLAKLGLGATAAKIGGGIAAGAGTGAAFDVAQDVAEGDQIGLGAGTLIGAGIPVASPIFGALTRATGRVAAKVGTETTGILTGTSPETIETAYTAARAGGSQLDTFTAGLRGKTTPEQLVNNVRDSVAVVQQTRNSIFRETLSELGETTVPTQVAKTSFRETLDKFKVQVGNNGQLIFDKSELRTTPAAQAKIQQAWDEINRMPDVLAIADLDTTRQAVKAIKSIAGDDPSSNRANALIEDAARSVRKAGEQVEGYGTMLDNFAESSEFLDELSRGLSTGDRATVDQAYRRLSTSLKTNNEQRMALLKELDEVTDGNLLSDISGQQLSEVYPRGIFRQILAGGAAVSAVNGGITAPLLGSLVLASPRVVGEVVRALGITGQKADLFIQAVGDAQSVLIKSGAIASTQIDDSSDETIN